jgi:hypothetical protein
MGFSSCTFYFNFKNTVSGATRGSGLINLSLSVHALPESNIYFDPGIGGESGIYYEDPGDIIGVESPPEVTHPARGGLIKTYCVGTSYFGKYHNGSGGEYAAVIRHSATECGWESEANNGKIEPEINEPNINVSTQSYAAGGSVTDEVNQNIYNQKLAEIDSQVRQQQIEDIAKNGLPNLTDVLKGITVDISKIRIDIGSINIGSM